MKLMTEMQDGCVHASGYCVDEECVDSSEAERLVHDAAAAHALILAVETLGERGPYVGPTKWIYAKADELMREWGWEAGK
jgi:hypothetical protein